MANKSIYLLILINLCLNTSCVFTENHENNVQEQHNKDEKDKNLLRKIHNKKINLHINVLDKNGLKQGRWVTKKIWESDTIANVYTYTNDTLNGYFEEGNRFTRVSGYYKMGKIDGIKFMLSDGKYKNKGYLMASFYIDGVFQWAAFGFDHHFLFPPKGFNIAVSDVYIKVPFINKKTWYEGKFVTVDQSKKAKSSILHVGVGIHKVYYENGNIHAEINYDKLTIKLYLNDKSNTYKNYSFKEYEKNFGEPVYKFVEDEKWK